MNPLQSLYGVRMKKSVFAICILAVTIPSFAMAGDRNHNKAPTAPAQMTDIELDRVTAGAAVSPTGEGVLTAQAAGGNQTNCPACTTPNAVQPVPGTAPGVGLFTAGRI